MMNVVEVKMVVKMGVTMMFVVMELKMMIINDWIVIIMDWTMIFWLDWKGWSIESF